MNRTTKNSFLLLVLGAAFCMAAPVWARTLSAVRTSGPRLDGAWDAAWESGAVADSFILRDPRSGELASLPTRVYVLYDESALYCGFQCLDTAPDSILGRLQRRDNDAGSDFVDIYLDTFHDRRNCYWFTLTAAGVQSEGTIANENQLDNSWDGLWQSAVARTDSSWVAEVRIPFSSIRHGGPRSDGWGLNFARKIERRAEAAFWQPVNPERNFRVGEMGTLLGLVDIAPADHIEFLPHALGRWDAPTRHKWASQNEAENLGFLVKLVPGASWTADLTYQPDFAQVDVDDEVINLSDYPVFLEEKRPFFLEMKDLFDTAPIQHFYTRRITDPDYGGRISGQQGGLRTSVLAAKNRTDTGALQDVSVGRALLNVGRASSIGVSGTYLAQGYSTFHAGTIGLDSRIRWGLRNSLVLSGAAVDRTGPQAQPVEARVSVDQDFGWFLGELDLTYRGKDYNINDLGWGNASNVLEQSVSVGRNYFPRSRLWRSLNYDVQGFHRSLTDGTLPSGGGMARVYGYTLRNWRAGLAVESGTYYRRNYWTAATGEYRDNFGLFVPEFHPYTVTWGWIYTDDRRLLDAGLEAQDGSFREGRRWSLIPSAGFRPRPNLDFRAVMHWQRVSGVADYNNYGNTDYRIWSLRARYSPSLTVSFRGTMQWVEERDELLANFLLAWNWSPGSWLYLVYDETRYRGSDPRSPLYELNYEDPGDRTLRAKLTWFVTTPWPGSN